MTHDSTNQEGFERWAERQGLVLTTAQGVDAMFRTYEDWHTEFAWRGWANRPHRETRVDMASHWPTPVQPVGVMGIPPNPPGSGSAKTSDALTWNTRTDGGNEAMIREAATRARAEMPEGFKPMGYDLTAHVDHIDDAGYVHWKLEDDKTLESCKARFPSSTVPFKGFPKVADTAHIGEVRCENATHGFPQCENIAVAPIPMILHCPKCGTQHIDADNSEDVRVEAAERGFVHGSRDWEDWVEKHEWTNPPHKSHLCRACRTVWRPADVCTTGVVRVETRGKADTWSPE